MSDTPETPETTVAADTVAPADQAPQAPKTKRKAAPKEDPRGEKVLRNGVTLYIKG